MGSAVEIIVVLAGLASCTKIVCDGQIREHNRKLHFNHIERSSVCVQIAVVLSDLSITHNFCAR